MKILGYHITSNRILANSDGEVCTSPPYLDFLLERKPETIKVFYHMNYSIANLLKMIGITKYEAQKLQNNNQFYTAPYNIKYIAGKFFSVKEGQYFGSPFAIFGDMSQYRPATFEGEETAETCLAKAREAQKTGEEVYKTLVSLGLSPTSLTSPVKAYEKEVLSKMNLPTVDDIPEEAGYYAYQCCHGNWLEAFQLGHWEKAYDYDINSAFPSELTKLLDLRKGIWIKKKEYQSEARYGYCKGIVTITAPFSPVIYYREGSEPNSLNYTPAGSWETFLPKQVVEFIYRWNLGTFRLEDGWWWTPTAEDRVFSNIIEQLYWRKEQSTGLGRETIKRTMSGIWGKLLQVQKDGFGDMFNPVYGAEVETNTRLRVAEFALQNKICPIHIAVDGLTSPKPVELPQNEAKIGRWELASPPEGAACVCAGTAVMAIKGRVKSADFSLDYDWLVEEIGKNPETQEYKIRKLSPVTLAVALNGNWEKLGQLHEITKVVGIGRDIKRCYKEFPQNGRELLSRQYGSEPWDISVVEQTVKGKEPVQGGISE